MKLIRFGEVKIGDVARKHINECLDSGQLTYGKYCQELEEKWAKLFNMKYSVGVNSGTSGCLAMLLSLYDHGAHRGDKIILPSLSFIATLSSVIQAGFQPIFCDIHLNNLVINEDLVERLIIDNSNVIGIMGVTLMGQAFNIEKLKNLCDKYDLWLLTDNAEGVGCKYKDKFIDEYSDMSSCSMYAAHLCFGVQNGEVTTNDKNLYESLLSVRSHGRPPFSLEFNHQLFGSNLMPNNLCCAIALDEVDQFWDTFNIRKNNIKKLREGLDCIQDYVYFCDDAENTMSSPHAFSMILKNGSINNFRNYLTAVGIESKLNFLPMYSHKGYQFLNIPQGTCPVAELAGQGCHIACHKYLSDSDIVYMIDKIKKYFGVN